MTKPVERCGARVTVVLAALATACVTPPFTSDPDVSEARFDRCEKRCHLQHESDAALLATWTGLVAEQDEIIERATSRLVNDRERRDGFEGCVHALQHQAVGISPTELNVEGADPEAAHTTPAEAEMDAQVRMFLDAASGTPPYASGVAGGSYAAHEPVTKLGRRLQPKRSMSSMELRGRCVREARGVCAIDACAQRYGANGG